MSSPRLQEAPAPGRPSRPGRRVPYWLSFGVSVAAIGALTLAFVLYVLPSRFVFQTGLPTSGVSFPVLGQPFEDRSVVMVEPRPDPVPPPVVEEEAEPAPVEAGPPPEGPAESLWRQVTPLLAAGNPDEALPLFERYLERYPDDHAVRMEYGIALARAGRPEWARETFLAVAQATGEPRARVELARTLAGQGAMDEAAEVYRDLLGSYPERHDLRLELASVLWTAGHPEEADRLVAAIPVGAPEHAEALEIRGLLAVAMAVPEEVEEAPAEPAPLTDPLDRAVAALEAGEPGALEALFREDREARPGDADRILAWADLFQYRMEDTERALLLLEERRTLAEPTPELELRRARLLSWHGEEARAEALLEEVLAAYPDHPEGWALLGDLRRWRGVRVAAAEAYERALALDPEEPQARAGRDATLETARLEMRNRVNPGLGVHLHARQDSDDFGLFEVAGRGALMTGAGWEMAARSGVRRVEGIRPGLGLVSSESGPFGELELNRWWREGTIRGGVTLGVEDSRDFGASPVFRGSLEARELGDWSLGLEMRRERAYAFLSAIEAYDYAIQADQVAVFTSGRPARRWSADARIEATRFTGDTPSTLRIGGLAAVYRDLAPWARVGVSTRALAFTDPAPFTGDRRVYWDPELFWVQELPVEVRFGGLEGWSFQARLSPGIGQIQERDGTEPYWSRQLGLEGGPRYQGDRGSLQLSLFTTRGREGGYRASGATLGVTLRPWAREGFE